MVNGRAGVRCARVSRLFVAVEDVKKQGLTGPGRNGVADDANLASIPAWRPGDCVLVAVKMQVIKGQRLDAFVTEVPFHGCSNLGQVGLMHYLVGFEIKGPITGAIEQGNRFLLAV